MVYYLAALFVGYLIGRAGHVIGGSIAWIPHHWIFGLIIMFAPLFLKKASRKIKILIVLFGLGVFVSDFNDFLRLRIMQPDDVKIVRFWGID